MQKKRVLITGGSGFLGCHLARKLLQLQYKVTLLDIAPLDAKDLVGKVQIVRADIRNKKKISEVIRGYDYLVHAAAALPILRSKGIIFSINVDGTRNVLEACKENKVKRVIFISTTAVYGVPKQLPETEASPITPIGYYGQSKVLAEQICKEFIKQGLSITIFRPKTFLGTERLGVFALWFEAIYTGKRVFILGSGKNKYQLLAVSDLVNVIAKALTSSVENEVFNVGAKEFSTWRKDLGAVIKHDRSTAKITSIPVFPSEWILAVLETLHLSPLAAWHYKTIHVPSYVSTAKVEKMLHWTPKKSNVDLLLESYIWYKNNRKQILAKKGNTHRVGWNFQLLNLFRRF